MTKRELAAWFCRILGAGGALAALLSVLSLLISVLAGPTGSLGIFGTSIFSVVPLALYGCLFLFADLISAQMTGDVWGVDREPIRDRRGMASVGLSCLGVVLLWSALYQIPQSLYYLWLARSYGTRGSSLSFVYGNLTALIFRTSAPLLQALIGFSLAFARQWFVSLRRTLEPPASPPPPTQEGDEAHD